MSAKRNGEGAFHNSTMGTAAAQRRWSVERLARWQSRPAVRRVTSRYSEWVHTDEGQLTMLLFGGLAWALVAGRLSRREFKLQVVRAARGAKLPPADARLMANSLEQTIRCGLFGSGQLDGASTEAGR